MGQDLKRKKILNKDYLNLLKARNLSGSAAPPVRARDGEKESHIYIYDVLHSSDRVAALFGGVSAESVAKEIASAGGTLYLHINSPGGDVFAGMAIYNALRQRGGGTVAIIEGIAASAAALLMLGADRVAAHEESMIMLHSSWGVTVGNAKDHLDQADILSSVDSLISGILEKKTGESREKISAWLGRDTYFTAREALDARLIDNVVDAAAPEAEPALEKETRLMKKFAAAMAQ